MRRFSAAFNHAQHCKAALNRRTPKAWRVSLTKNVVLVDSVGLYRRDEPTLPSMVLTVLRLLSLVASTIGQRSDSALENLARR